MKEKDPVCGWKRAGTGKCHVMEWAVHVEIRELGYYISKQCLLFRVPRTISRCK